MRPAHGEVSIAIASQLHAAGISSPTCGITLAKMWCVVLVLYSNTTFGNTTLGSTTDMTVEMCQKNCHMGGLRNFGFTSAQN